MKTLTLIATLLATLMPGVAMAMCSGHEVTISCADGQIYDDATNRCVTQTS